MVNSPRVAPQGEDEEFKLYSTRYEFWMRALKANGGSTWSERDLQRTAGDYAREDVQCALASAPPAPPAPVVAPTTVLPPPPPAHNG